MPKITLSGSQATYLRGDGAMEPSLGGVTASGTPTAGQVLVATDTAGAKWANAPVDFLNVVSGYGADPAGLADSTTAIGNAVTAAVASGRPVYIPAGTYKVTATLNWKHTGLTVIGDGINSTVISMATSNIPIVQFAGSYQRISGINFRYATAQTTSNTSGIAAEFGDDTVGSCFMSRFADLEFTNSYIGMAINPAVSVIAGMFSCLFEDIHVNTYAQNALYLVGSNGNGADCTGCVFTNIYTQNGDSAAASWPVFLEYWDEVSFHQLNIEHVSLASADALALVNVGNAVLAGVHFEEVTQSADAHGLIYVSASSSATKLTCYGVTSRFNVFQGATQNSVFRANGTNGAKIVLDGFVEDTSNTQSAPARYMLDFNSATNVRASLQSADTGNVTALSANAGASDYLTIGLTNWGTSTQSGNGSTTAFNIAHGLGYAPSRWGADPGSTAAAAVCQVTATSTNLVVTFNAAPANGSNNLTWNWWAAV